SSEVICHVDLELTVSVLEHELMLTWRFNESLFAENSISSLSSSFEELLQCIIKTPEVPYLSFPMSSHTTKGNFNLIENNRDWYEQNLFQQISASWDDRLDNIAIVSPQSELTYLELKSQVNSISQYLLHKGIGCGDVVAVNFLRGPELVVTLMALLNIGCAYVPIDPSLPKRKINYMLTDSGANLMLTNVDLNEYSDLNVTLLKYPNLSDLAKFDKATKPLVEKLQPSVKLAYIIYTSGSTGKPKGVEISQAALANFLFGAIERLSLDHSTNWLALTTVTFDISAFELIAPLVVGGKLHIFSNEKKKESLYVTRYIREQAINVVQATPSGWQLLLNSEPAPANGLLALCGGEALQESLLNELSNYALRGVVHCYGPTEATIWSHMSFASVGQKIAITDPLPNYGYYIVNRNMALQPDGAIGELVLTGASLAEGYRNNPSLTQSNFVACDFANEEASVVYKTGDIVRSNSQGELQFLGRCDNQVKVRGVRIELGEIEHFVNQLQGIRTGVVSVVPVNGVDTLVAYIHLVNSAQSEITTVLLGSEQMSIYKKALNEFLADYMIPEIWLSVDDFQLTVSGKIDRNALPSVDVKNLAGNQYVAPESELEVAIAQMWSSLLGRERVSLTDNFFNLGG
ncbi:amino acid adenylation domain-containing protein, partial [Pseudoalteromonas sp. MMG006]|uniref:amino acid adenylation domain-containing protein n=1 Tax=Pseudoalteromonas sp. MMG006 TaxID=2822683 RepID=UPI001B39874C